MQNGVLKCNNEPFGLDKHFQNFPLVRPECLGSPQKAALFDWVDCFGKPKKDSSTWLNTRTNQGVTFGL